ncbi:hypothetical protein EV361DRAFT_919923 [Lentinula raphanica]|nr:hypothetical protein EV361DRAFT_919923 [Lentinula raphanica]
MSSIKTESIHEFNYPRSASPTKESLRPNAHPYAIKTTSTALLSRSNSSSRNHYSSHHHYVPQTPPATSPGPRKHSSAHYRHRYSTSLSTDNLPRPLPVPPSPTKDVPNEGSGKRFRTYSHTAVSSAPLTLEDLPPNPKLWTPSQLCAYLATALRVKSGESLELPAQIARDIAGFVRDSRITGKAFLRLDERELEAFGVNKLWRNALLRASQNLRQNVLKGHIWGFVDELDGITSGLNFPSADHFNSGSVEEDEDDDSTPHRRRRSTSQPQIAREFSGSNQSSFKHPFPNGLPEYSSASSSSSTDDLFSPIGIEPFVTSASSLGDYSRYSHHTRTRNGKVKGMVDTFERSSSFDESDPISVKLMQEIKGKRELDLENLRKLRRERSGSISSISSGSFGSSHSPTSSSDDGSDIGALAVIASPEEYNVSTITSSRPLPSRPLQREADDGFSTSRVSEHEEPSIEELLAREGGLENALSSHSNLSDLQSAFSKNSTFAKGTFSISKGKGKAKKREGVYAWEAEVEDLGVAAPGKATAKRVTSQVPIPPSMLSSAPVPTAKDVFVHTEVVSGFIQEEPTEQSRPGELHSSVPKSGQGSGTHTPSRPLPEIPLHPSLVSLLEPEEPQEMPSDDVYDLDKQDNAKESEAETMLRASIAETAELLRAVDARLGEVERKLDMLEIEVKDLEVASAVRDKQRSERSQSNDAIQTTNQDNKVEEVPRTDTFFSEWPIVRKVLNRLLRSSSSGQSSSIRSRVFDSRLWQSPPNIDPQTLSQLPPYVLLVGLGVCAVVLKVFAKRLIGRR